jgi:hypothetical protein
MLVLNLRWPSGVTLMPAAFLWDARLVLHDGCSQHGAFYLHVVHRNFHSSSARLHSGHASFNSTHAGLNSFESFLNALEPLGDTVKPLIDVMIYPVKFVYETSDALRHGCVFLTRGSSRDSGFVVVPGILDSKTPLIVELHLADGLRAPWAIDFTRAGVSFLGCAVVLDSTPITDQVIPCRLAIAIVAGAELDNAVALVLCNTLHGAEEIFEAPVDSFWGRS